jgi:ATP-binding cassette subfamily B protein
MKHSRSDRLAGFRLARRSLEFVTGHKRPVLGIMGLALVLAILGAADPLAMKFLFDALGATERQSIVTAIGILLGLELARAALGGWMAVLTWRVRLGIDYRMRARLLDKLLALPMEYHARHGVGGTMNEVNQSVTAFVAAFSEIAFSVLSSVLYLGLSVFAMWRMDWRLALVVLAFTPIPALVGALAAGEQTARERSLMEHWTKLYSRLNEALSGIRTVKVFAMERAEHNRFLTGQSRGNSIVARGVKTDTMTGAIRALAATLARIAAIGVGSMLILKGQLTVGALVAFLGYVSGLFGPVQGLTNIYQTLRKAAVALERTYGILDAEETAGDEPHAVELRGARGDIEFKDVTFAHGENGELFTDLNLRVRAGETVAMVGPSGSGKSTIVSLLLRLHVPDAGAITIDGHDINGVTRRSLRQQVAHVGQEIHLFNDTVRSNIAYGSPL